jgi:hypothetical protein
MTRSKSNASSRFWKWRRRGEQVKIMSKDRRINLDYNNIRGGLQILREDKNAAKVFGADSHGFLLNPPLPEEAVRDFEVSHQVLLPAEYRDFLIHLGNGGAGPAYGLFKLGEMDDCFKHTRWHESDGFIGKLSEAFPHRSAWNDRTGEPEYDESRENDSDWEEKYQLQMDEWEKFYWDPANVNGAIPICHLGCAYRQWLVVTGPEAGFIWDDNRADYGGLNPHQSNGRDRVTFSQWYSDWLNDALMKLRSKT